VSLPLATLVIDTTGPDPRRDRVRGYSAAIFDVTGHRKNLGDRVDVESCAQTNPDDSSNEESLVRRPWRDVAVEIRKLVNEHRIVTHDASRALTVLAAEGVLLPKQPIDLAELASIVVPGVASSDVIALCAFLGIPMPPSRQVNAELLADTFVALLARVAEYDEGTLDRLLLHVGDGGWSFADLFDPDLPLAPRVRGRSPKLTPPELLFMRERAREEPLAATGSLQQVNPRAVEEILGSEGTLSRVVAGFERRPQQERMALAVADAINEQGQLLVEAGTGTGKSLAYLVPAALASTERGEPVVLSTNTLALQDQLLRKDVPDLVEALRIVESDKHVDVVAVKGRANYLCLRKWFTWERQASVEQDEARLKAKILAWLPRTETGDRSELHLSGGEESHWRHIAEEEGACDPGSCPFFQRGQCFVFRARRSAEAAHLVVVNHALLLTDAVSSNRVLPDYDTLVIDEAHHLEDQATTQFTVSLVERDIVELADAILGHDGIAHTGVLAGAVAFLLGAVEDEKSQRQARKAQKHLDSAKVVSESLRSAGANLFASLELIHADTGERANGSDRARRITAATRAAPAWEAVESAWDQLLCALREAETILRWFASAVSDVDDVAAADLAEAGERQQLLLSDLSNTMRAGTELAAKFASALDSPESERVFWLDRTGVTNRLVFRSAPLDVSVLLQDRLFKKRKTTVLTSATLAVDGRCDYLASRLGIPDASSLIVPSPFDYRSSVLLFLSDDMPEPTHSSYQAALEQTLIDAIAATRGRALVLFTSHALLSDVARSITDPLRDRGVIVLSQRRDGSPQQLTERLRREENVAVLGTSSLWEGVDVAGDALSLLVITRLPFNVPSDPVFAARSEAYDDAFFGYAVPQAVLRFKQGFGRLIRTSQDRGVCAVLDRRILTKRYGATFVQSLPECTVEVGSMFDLARAAREWIGGPAATQLAFEQSGHRA
jgi:DNA polymerase-3 subunit epsilon/ATP-dependent DNA helicase DinG